MQFKVPQDVQREDTIIFQLTLKQMIILGVGGGLAYGLYVTLSRSYFIEIWLPPVAIVSIITLAFAFLKVYSLPFYEFLMDFIEYHLLPRERIWIQATGKPFISSFQKKQQKKVNEKIKEQHIKKTQGLGKITKVLDTRGGEEELTKEELDKEDKKEGLKQLINQNYKE